MSNHENVYVIFALREANDQDDETDFIIDDIFYVIEGASKSNGLTLSEKEQKLKQRFPKHKILTTYQSLFELIKVRDELKQLEAEFIADGVVLHSEDTGRIADAFNWDKKIDVIRQQGRC